MDIVLTFPSIETLQLFLFYVVGFAVTKVVLKSWSGREVCLQRVSVKFVVSEGVCENSEVHSELPEVENSRLGRNQEKGKQKKREEVGEMGAPKVQCWDFFYRRCLGLLT
jgi:hypothetical protein